MKTKIERKEFLRLSFFGMIASLLPIEELNAINKATSGVFDKSNLNSSSTELAAQAKEAFFRKEYVNAENLYLQCITSDTSHIQYYDGLQNVYAVLKKNIQIIQLYKDGLDQNPNLVSFYDRLAKSIIRVELGNKKIISNIHSILGVNSLFDKAIELYQSAIAIDATKNYLSEGLNYVNNLKSLNADSIYAHNNIALKNNKKINRTNYKNRFNNKSNSDLISLLTEIDLRKRNTLYITEDIVNREKGISSEKKRINRILSNRFYDIEDLNNAIIYAKNAYELDKMDANSVRSLSYFYKKNDDINNFILIKREWDLLKNNPWSKLSLMSALEFAYKKTNNVDYLTEAISIGNSELNSSSLKPMQQFNISIKTAKLLRKNNNLDLALQLYTNYLDLPDLSNGQMHKVSIGYIKTIVKSGDLASAKKLIRLALKDLKGAANLNEVKIAKVELKAKSKTRLMYLRELYKIFKIEGNKEKKKKVLKRMLKINRKDKFVKKSMNN